MPPTRTTRSLWSFPDGDVKRLLEMSGVPEEKMENFDREYAETAGEKTTLMAENITDSRKFSIKTPGHYHSGESGSAQG